MTVFKNYFLFLKTKTLKTYLEKMDMFLFFVFSKTIFFYNNKNIISLFFHYLNNKLFSYFLFIIFVFP